MKAELITKENGDEVGYIVDCPGCKTPHVIYTKGPVKWSFNGDINCPTFHPSLLVNKDMSNKSAPRCHSFIRDGVWNFLSDCTHDLAGKNIPMSEVE